MSQEIIEGYRLSPQQRRLWLLRQSDRCAQCAVRIDGELHVDVLEEAFRQVVSQHESLRTSFKLLGGMTIPVQVISDRPDVLFKRYDLQQLTAEQQHSRVKSIFDDTARRNRAYDQLPLLHCDLIQLSPNKHDLIISLPVACADAPSLHCLVHQIADAYPAVSQGEKPSPIDTMQYADFSEWQNELLEAQGGLAGQYWRQQSLTEFDAQKLPFEKRSVSAEIFQPATLSVEVSAATCNRINEIANTCDVSTSAFALACYQILLSRLTGSSSVVIGVALDGRKFAELTEAPEYFLKEAVHRTHLHVVVVNIDARAHLDLFDLDDLLLLAGLVLALLGLVLVLAVIEDLGDRRDGRRRDLDQVETDLLGHRDGLARGDDAMHGPVFEHQADLGNVDHSVDTRTGLTGRVVFLGWSGYGLLLFRFKKIKTPPAAGPERSQARR